MNPLKQLKQWEHEFKPYHLNWYATAPLEQWLKENKAELRKQGIVRRNELSRAKVNDGQVDPRFIEVASIVGLDQMKLRRVFGYFVINRWFMFNQLISTAPAVAYDNFEEWQAANDSCSFVLVTTNASRTPAITDIAPMLDEFNDNYLQLVYGTSFAELAEPNEDYLPTYQPDKLKAIRENNDLFFIGDKLYTIE